MSSTKQTPARVLVADDDPAVRLATVRLLQQAGYECESAADAEQARALLTEKPFDLLISDILMPGNTALELIQNLPPLAQGMRVILLTGHPTVQSAIQSVRLPVVAYLVKPPDPDEFLACVSQAVAEVRAYRTVASNRQHLQQWINELDQIEHVLQTGPGGSPAPLDACLGITLRNLLGALMDLKRLTELVTQRRDPNQSLQEASLLNALQETITVLEKTKQSFKSKELGDLRRRLESLVQKQP